MTKKYLKQNVYDAANKRIDYVFKNFERIYVSFSGGKDSGVMLNLVLDYMRKNNISKKIGVLFVDLEAQYQLTMEYIDETFKNNSDLLDIHWICLPLNLRNATSVFQPFWTCWDNKQSNKWVRKLPNDCINESNHGFPFFKEKMEFEEFIVKFGEWYSYEKNTACLVGIRSDESLNRYRTVVSKNKKTFNGKQWTTKISDCLYNAYPIYDWTTEDIWTANAINGWDYNKLYDIFYKAGISIHNQRICQPYGDDQRIGLNLFRVIEQDTWEKVVNRVSGANFGNIYCGDKAMGYRKVQLPKGHTWKSYTKLLLNTLPNELANHYKRKFIKFMRYWSKTGCPYPGGEPIPRGAIKTGRKSNRGNKDKETVVYKKIPDFIDAKIESQKLAPSWRRMAICILKNDHLCKSLSFTQTKQQQQKIAQMLEKYKEL